MIKNENDFLGFLISIKDKNNNVDIPTVFKNLKLSHAVLSDYLKSLEEKSMVKYIDTCTYHINPLGLNSYVSNAKKATLSVFKAAKLFLQFIIPYLLGLFSNDIYAFIMDFIRQEP